MENGSWDNLRVLLAVHRGGSLLRAGLLLGISTSTTGRRLDALEQAIGDKLVHRTQNGTQLTSTGLRLLRVAKDVEHGLQSQRRDQHSVARTIRISVPDGLARPIAEALVPIYRDHPATAIELVGESRIVDLAKREADIAVRLLPSTSHFLIEKKATTLRFSLFGSPKYVRSQLNGHTLHPADAAAQSFVGLDPRWVALPQEQWLIRLGATRFVFRSGSINAVTAVVAQSIGLAALPDEVGYDAGLIRIETELPGPIQPLYLVYHRDLRREPHIRAVLALIQACLLRKPAHPTAS